MSRNIPPNKQQVINDILANARLSTNDEIIDYLEYKTKLNHELISEIVANERTQFSSKSGYEIDFGKYAAV